MNTYNKEIQIAVVGGVCLTIAMISKSSSVGFILGVLFMAASDQIKSKR